MKPLEAILKIPEGVALSEALSKKYPDRRVSFDTADRAGSLKKHHELMLTMAEGGQRFLCDCRPEKQLKIMVRMRGAGYLATMPHTGLEHDSACPFHRAPITSHVKESIEYHDDGTLAVRLGFHLGEALAEKKPAEPGTKNEASLRTRRVSRQLNRFGSVRGHISVLDKGGW